MPTAAERTLGALQFLLRGSHFAGPDGLPALVSGAGAQLGAERAVLYLIDYDQVLLATISEIGATTAPPPVAVEGTLAGRTFSECVQHTSTAGSGPTLFSPVLDGTERVGVLQLDFPASEPLDDELRAGCLDVAALLAELVLTSAMYGDAVERTRRRAGMTVPAEMQWRLLPPLTFVSPRASVAGVLVPAERVAGDSFDYALNGDRLHVMILDAMGHGLQAALLSAVAISTLRNARRSGLELTAVVREMDAAIAAEFGSVKFVTAIVGELDVTTGWWRWTTCGHPPALLVRNGRVVKQLDSVVDPPLGLGLLGEHPKVGQERLQPGDRLLLYTDGVAEARGSDGQFFGTARLVEFISRQASDGRPAAETLRRLNHAILNHQEGSMQDDATTVLVEWLTDQPVSVNYSPSGAVPTVRTT